MGCKQQYILTLNDVLKQLGFLNDPLKAPA